MGLLLASHVFTDCPTWVTVDRASTCGSLKSGDMLTCKSDGYPQPSYTWTDGNGDIVASGPDINLTQSYERLTCSARSDFTTPCSQSKTRYNVILGTLNSLGQSLIVRLLLLLLNYRIITTQAGTADGKEKWGQTHTLGERGSANL